MGGAVGVGGDMGSIAPNITQPVRSVEHAVPRADQRALRTAFAAAAEHVEQREAALRVDVEDRADEGVFNRILWFSVRGDQPYPGDW